MVLTYVIDKSVGLLTACERLEQYTRVVWTTSDIDTFFSYIILNSPNFLVQNCTRKVKWQSSHSDSNIEQIPHSESSSEYFDPKSLENGKNMIGILKLQRKKSLR